MTLVLGISTLFDTVLVDDARALWCLEDVAFVRTALNALVNDDIAPDDIEKFVILIRQGYSKHFVLASIAKHWGAAFFPGRLPGLRRRLSHYRLGGLPVVGFVLRRIFNLPSEKNADRRLRVIENQLYLLAKMAFEQRCPKNLPAAPWGGLHRVAMLHELVDLESKMEPAVKAIYAALLEAANGARHDGLDMASR